MDRSALTSDSTASIGSPNAVRLGAVARSYSVGRLGFTRRTFTPASSIGMTELLDIPNCSLAPTTAIVAGDRRRLRLERFTARTLWSPAVSERGQEGGWGDLDEIAYEKGDGVGRITLHRPEQLNPISARVGGPRDQIEWALDDAAGDPAIGAVLVRGAGKAFSGGGDLTGNARR